MHHELPASQAALDNWFYKVRRVRELVAPSPEGDSANGIVQAPGSEPEEASESVARTANSSTSDHESTTNNSPITSLNEQVPQVRGPEDRDSQRDIGENDVFVARVEEIFHRKLEILNRQEEGSFSGRRAIRHKGRRVDNAALEEVNRLIGTLWDTGPRENKNFWVLNCMVVAGARTVHRVADL